MKYIYLELTTGGLRSIAPSAGRIEELRKTHATDDGIEDAFASEEIARSPSDYTGNVVKVEDKPSSTTPPEFWRINGNGIDVREDFELQAKREQKYQDAVYAVKNRGAENVYARSAFREFEARKEEGDIVLPSENVREFAAGKVLEILAEWRDNGGLD